MTVSQGAQCRRPLVPLIVKIMLLFGKSAGFDRVRVKKNILIPLYFEYFSKLSRKVLSSVIIMYLNFCFAFL